MMDVLLRYIVEAIQRNIPPDKNSANWALVAIGGYGRGELNPHSDIDFMFLHDGSLVSRGRPATHLKELTDGVLYTLWDIGLKIGHSTRSVGDCVDVANGDMHAKTSLIEARLITGNKNLFKGLQRLVWDRCIHGFEEAYIAARLEDQEERRTKFGNSATMQEPNIKNGCGGLRDFQNLLWMAYFKYRTRTLAELQEREFVTSKERKQLEAAYDFLLRVRTEMHYLTGRPLDGLTLQLQGRVAAGFNFPQKHILHRVEAFMREYFDPTRAAHAMNARILDLES
jgi:[protein-PII] uridylyltransferase